MKLLTYRLLFATVLLCLLTLNCFANHTKTPPDPRFALIESITILPMLDTRVDKKSNVDLQKLQKHVTSILRKKNYQAIEAETSGDAGEIVEEDLQEAKPEWIKRLGPSEARWVMVIGLNDAATKVTLGSTTNVEVMGFLYDKQTATLVWKNTGIGRAGQGGLAGIAMKGLSKSEAFSNALGSLLATIPKRENKKK
jgi:hypothetical protein